MSGPLRPLRVLLGLEGLALGGCPINALDLGRELVSRGHAVHVFAIDESVRTSVLPYARRSGFSPTLLPRHGGTLARARQIRRLARRHEADVVHVFGPWMGAAATIAAADRAPRSAVVTNWMMSNVRYVPRRTPLILGTRALQHEAEEIQGRSVALMEPPVDLELDAPAAEAGRAFRRDLGLGDDHVVVVVVGRVDTHLKEEGLRHAVQAVVRLDHPDLRLVVVGDGDAFARVQADARGANAALGREAVLLTGSLQDPRPAYDAADITLGMGGSALRCLAHGKPLVVLGENGFATTFEPATRDHFAEHGFFGDEPAADPAGHLSEQVRALLDPARRRRLGAYGSAEVAAFGLPASADRLTAVYRDALRALPSPGARLADAARLTARAVAHETRAAVRTRRSRRAGPADQP